MQYTRGREHEADWHNGPRFAAKGVARSVVGDGSSAELLVGVAGRFPAALQCDGRADRGLGHAGSVRVYSSLGVRRWVDNAFASLYQIFGKLN